MTKREYLVELLNASKVKAYSQPLGFSNEAFIDAALQIVLKLDINNNEIEEDCGIILNKANADFHNQLVHDEERSVIPLITSIEVKQTPDTLNYDDSQWYRTVKPSDAKINKKKATPHSGGKGGVSKSSSVSPSGGKDAE